MRHFVVECIAHAASIAYVGKEGRQPLSRSLDCKNVYIEGSHPVMGIGQCILVKKSPDLEVARNNLIFGPDFLISSLTRDKKVSTGFP